MVQLANLVIPRVLRAMVLRPHLVFLARIPDSYINNHVSHNAQVDFSLILQLTLVKLAQMFVTLVQA